MHTVEKGSFDISRIKHSIPEGAVSDGTDL